MTLKTFLGSLLVTLVLMLAGVPVATAQVAVATFLELTPEDPPQAENWTGEPMDANVETRLCWDEAGGVNPLEESFTVSAAAEGAPTGETGLFNASVEPRSTMFTPPVGPTEDAGCTNPQDFVVTFEADEVLGGQSVEFRVVFVSTDAEPIMGGNFEPPEEAGHSFNITMESPTETDGEEEEPASAAGAWSLLALSGFVVVFALLRRR